LGLEAITYLKMLIAHCKCLKLGKINIYILLLYDRTSLLNDNNLLYFILSLLTARLSRNIGILLIICEITRENNKLNNFGMWQRSINNSILNRV